jgi:hypothetical protein
MIKKGRLANYEPPFVKDISMNFAKGQVSTEGVCKTGTAPFYTCNVGPSILPACNPTGGTPDVSNCGGGGYHSWPACRGGGSAATVCGSGHGQQ